MLTPGRLDLVVQRWTPFIFLIDFPGLDFSEATFAMQVRLYGDAPGDPILSLVNAAANAQGLSVSVTEVEGAPMSTVQIRINETTLEAILLNSGKAGAPIGLVWDIHITGGGLPKTRVLEGSFTIKPGATQ